MCFLKKFLHCIIVLLKKGIGGRLWFTSFRRDLFLLRYEKKCESHDFHVSKQGLIQTIYGPEASIIVCSLFLSLHRIFSSVTLKCLNFISKFRIKCYSYLYKLQGIIRKNFLRDVRIFSFIFIRAHASF